MLMMMMLMMMLMLMMMMLLMTTTMSVGDVGEDGNKRSFGHIADGEVR